jgi:uncharacterized protein (TIGR03435 family)
MFRTVSVAAAFCAIAFAQTPASPTFEVASIKPAAPQEMGRMMMGSNGGPRPGSRDPGQYTATNLPLSRLIMEAYNIRSYQVTGPSWIDSTRFDVVAKVPVGATEEQFRLMLQNLLAERFKLKIHKESKDVPIYALLVGKGGIKMKESAPLDPNATDTPRPMAPPQSGGGGGGGAVRDRDGMPRMAPGGRGAMMMMGPNGMRMQGGHMTMDRLADILSNQLGRPVVDMTGLTAEYDYTLDFSPEGLQMGPKGMPMPPPGAGGGDRGGPSPDGARDSAPTLFTAVREQLGLKLDARRGPVDLIVVDNAEKTPTEN